eukprot:173531-Rhodomonas_salina.1
MCRRKGRAGYLFVCENLEPAPFESFTLTVVFRAFPGRIGNKEAGRIEMELFEDKVPKTVLSPTPFACTHAFHVLDGGCPSAWYFFGVARVHSTARVPRCRAAVEFARAYN